MGRWVLLAEDSVVTRLPEYESVGTCSPRILISLENPINHLASPEYSSAACSLYNKSKILFPVFPTYKP